MQLFRGLNKARLIATLYSVRLETPNMEGLVLVFMSLRNRVAQLYSQALGSLFVTSYY